MIKIEYNILNDNQLSVIDDFIKHFNPDEIPAKTTDGYRNDYFKQRIELPEDITKKVKSVINKHTNKGVEIMAAWLNKIDVNSNQDDDFHRDDTDMSFVIYPHHNFVGGELELRDNILPIESNIGYIILHNVEHRVRKVTDGIRWSVAFFCQYSKETKNLI